MSPARSAPPTMVFDFRASPAAGDPTARPRTIDRRSPVPLYHQLYQILLGKISAGDWPPGAALPTEQQLSAEYAMSRTTVRQALQQLVLDGCLSRQQGRGTFVTRAKVRHGPQRPFGMSGYLRAHGLRPGWRLLGMQRLQPPPVVAAALGLAEQVNVLCVRRLRLADDEPVGLHTVYIPFPLAAEVKGETMTVGDSSLAYLEESLGMTLSESHRIIEAVPARKEEARALGLRIGAPLLLVRRTTVAADGQPVEYMHAVYRGDRFEYYVHLQH